MNIYTVDNYHDNKPAYFYTLDNCFISDAIKTNEV
jgi:hypothetical protein